MSKCVRAHIESSDLTIAQVAKRAGLPERRLSRLLQCDTRLLATDMRAIAAALGKQIETLYAAPGRRRAS